MISYALALKHAEDPAEVIWRTVRTPREIDGLIPIDNIKIGGADLLVAVYKPSEESKTASGLIIPAKSRDESNFQGITGLILKMGPHAFQSEKTERWYTHNDQFNGDPANPYIGSWVVFDIKSSKPMLLDKQMCRIITDEYIYGIVGAPDLVA